MGKSLLIFIVIGVGLLYFLTGFIGDIQEEEDRYRNAGYEEKHKYDEYHRTDSIGQAILDLTGASSKVQMGAWKESRLKKEFITLFPYFSEMKIFVKERTRGEDFQAKLLADIDNIESKYFSGKMNAEQAKRALD